MSDSTPAGRPPDAAGPTPGRPDFTSPHQPWGPQHQPTPPRYGPPAAGSPSGTPRPGPGHRPSPPPGPTPPGAPAAEPWTLPPRPAAGYPPPDGRQPPPPKRRSPRTAGVLLVAAALALVVGGSAGYVGARYGSSSATQPEPASGVAPSVAPGSRVSSAAPPPAPAPRSERGDTVRIADTVLPSTVTIEVRTATGRGLGSGFVLDDQGRVMTNSHVVAGADDGSITVEFAGGRRSEASLLGRSPSYDLAVLEVADGGNAPAVDFGNSDRTRVGEQAVAVGAPLGLDATVTEGIISAIDRPVAVGDAGQDDGGAYLNALQTDAAINPGNSGGPLVNDAGRVIGVNSAILSSSRDRERAGNIGIGFAIPINQAREIGALLIDDGYATYPVIGASVLDEQQLRGVRLSDVTVGSGADRAGLHAGDVITAINGDRVSASEELIVAIRNHRPGDTVTLRYLRGGSSAEVQVTLGSERG